MLDSKSQSSEDPPESSELVIGSKSKQFLSVSISPDVSIVLTIIDTVESSATGSGGARGSDLWVDILDFYGHDQRFSAGSVIIHNLKGCKMQARCVICVFNSAFPALIS